MVMILNGCRKNNDLWIWGLILALLVLILERSKMVGLLKAMGAKNKLIQG